VNVRDERNPNGRYGFGILSSIAETKPHRRSPGRRAARSRHAQIKDFAGNHALVVGITVI
jgi:hypothetical protein